MNASKKKWNGEERRTRPINDRRCEQGCMEHSGLCQRISGIEDKTNFLEDKGFLTAQSYWWTTGILVSILMAVLSASIYVTFQEGQTLREIKAAQMTLSVQIGYVQRDIEALKIKVK